MVSISPLHKRRSLPPFPLLRLTPLSPRLVARAQLGKGPIAAANNGPPPSFPSAP
jgi:hypothetical protein